MSGQDPNHAWRARLYPKKTKAATPPTRAELERMMEEFLKRKEVKKVKATYGGFND